MSLTTFYITNQPQIAQIAEECSVDRIWVDLELRGKEKRQEHMNSVISFHTLEDVSAIRQAITTAKLQVRINPLSKDSEREINEVIDRGADYIMLPMYRTCEEARRFIQLVGGRAKTMLLLETIDAEHCLDEVAGLSGLDEVHVGLNDLSLQYGLPFMFELLANGKIDEICGKLRAAGKTFGFGGIAQMGEGLLPAQNILAEHYRLGSSMVILSRSFLNTNGTCDLNVVRQEFRTGMQAIRAFEAFLQEQTPAFFADNHRQVMETVAKLKK